MRYSNGLAIVLIALVTAPQRAAPTLAITSIAIVDAARGALLRDRTVLVDGSRIVRIGPTASTRVPAGARVLEHHVWPPVESDERRTVLWRELAANGVAMVPTLVTWPIRLEPPNVIIGRLDKGSIPSIQYVPRTALVGWRDQLAQLQQESPLDWAGIHRGEMRNIREMDKAGMSLLPGTDAGAPLVVPGFSLHDELGLLVRAAGLTPAQAVEAATAKSARVAGLGDSLGSIDHGKIADFVLLDANPLLDIANTKRISAVVSNGRLFDRAALDRLLAAAGAGSRGTGRAPPLREIESGWLAQPKLRLRPAKKPRRHTPRHQQLSRFRIRWSA